MCCTRVGTPCRRKGRSLATDGGFKVGAFGYISGNWFQGSNALYFHVFMLFMCACMVKSIQDFYSESERDRTEVDQIHHVREYDDDDDHDVAFIASFSLSEPVTVCFSLRLSRCVFVCVCLCVYEWWHVLL